jgi:hypothetical protein
MDDRGVGVRFPAGASDFYFLDDVQPPIQYVLVLFPQAPLGSPATPCLANEKSLLPAVVIIMLSKLTLCDIWQFYISSRGCFALRNCRSFFFFLTLLINVEFGNCALPTPSWSEILARLQRI